MKKLLLSGAVVAFTVTSALAQTTVSSEYYVVRDATTKKCTIVDKKPTTQSSMDHRSPRLRVRRLSLRDPAEYPSAGFFYIGTQRSHLNCHSFPVRNISCACAFVVV